MRQKAAEAWRSLALRNAVMTNQPAFQGSGGQSFVAEPHVAETDIIQNSPQTLPNEGFGGMGLGIVMGDMEKQLLVGGDDFGMELSGGLSSALPDYARRPRGLRAITRSRLMLALGGIICLMGAISAFRSRPGGSL
jgi:hypothetical protein